MITYFLSRSEAGILSTEWRIFDPATRTDTLFGSFSARGVYWDSTETNVEYLSEDMLFRARWELEAQPWPVLRLPDYGIVDWWFNTDSLCWQGMKVRAVSYTPPCQTELWQSDRDGAKWRLAHAETTECTDSHTYPGGWRVPDPRGIRRRAAIGLGQLQDAMTVDAWGGTPEPIPPPRGESAGGFQWYYIPFRSAPGRGLALRIGQRSPGLKTFMVPFYLMDRSRGTQRLLETPTLHRDQESWHMGMQEHDGFLLVSGIRTFVFDLSTGAQILPRPTNDVRQAVWIRRPAPASVDSVGLRRLRARFR